MNDATAWIDPELVAAGQLLQSRGLVAADRTQAPLSAVRAAVDRIWRVLSEGSVPLQRERDIMLPGPLGQVPYRQSGTFRPKKRRRAASISTRAADSCSRWDTISTR